MPLKIQIFFVVAIVDFFLQKKKKFKFSVIGETSTEKEETYDWFNGKP